MIDFHLICFCFISLFAQKQNKVVSFVPFGLGASKGGLFLVCLPLLPCIDFSTFSTRSATPSSGTACSDRRYMVYHT